MPQDEPESLWAFGDPEPWRRGRFAIALISALVLLGHAAAAISSLLNREISRFLIISVVGCIAVFLLFLIWIGQNWARWIISPFFALAGFWLVVRGILFGGIGASFLIGVAALTIFSYLAFSPAVYDFARRQREGRSLMEIIIAAAALLLLLGTVGSGLFAVQLYKSGLEREAVEFAQLTFHRAFINRDPHFLEDHASAGRKYSRPQEFINLVDQLGEAKSVGPFASKFTFKLDGYSLRVAGTARTRALFATDGVWVTIQIAGSHGDWQVEHLSFDY